MTTDFVHFHADALPWQALGTHGLRCKALSWNTATGGMLNLVDIPEGWRGGGVAHYHAAFEEVYILSGSVTVSADRWYVEGDYFYRPADVVHGHDERAREGCRSLIRSDGPLTLNLIHEPSDPDEYPRAAHTDPRGHILQLPTVAIPWTTLAGFPEAWRIKPLSHDPVSGARTIMARIPAGWQASEASEYPAGWSAYVLDGTLEIGADRLEPDSFGEGAAGTGPFGAASSSDGCTLFLWLGPTETIA